MYIYTSKKIPPYGKKVIANFNAGIYPKNDIFLLIDNPSSSSAKFYNRTQWTLVFNPAHSPHEFVWPVWCCSILIIEKIKISSDLLKKLLHELFAHGALIIRVVLLNNKLIVYKRT